MLLCKYIELTTAAADAECCLVQFANIALAEGALLSFFLCIFLLRYLFDDVDTIRVITEIFAAELLQNVAVSFLCL